MECAVSVIIGTRNRATALTGALESLIKQVGAVRFEVLVVDNGSTDDTRLVVEGFGNAACAIRYCFESRPGVSFARNTGAQHARAPLLAFMDDDQVAAPDWVLTIESTFRAEPEVHFLGGRNIPAPESKIPEWVTPELFGPLSLVGRGDTACPISREHWMCLAGGNMACRAEVFAALGGFGSYRRSQDRELTLRLLLAGYTGRYAPNMIMYLPLEPERLTRSYFRRWHDTEGRVRARYRFLERFDHRGRLLPGLPTGRAVCGISLFVYRQWLTESGRWLAALVKGRPREAFGHELRARQTFHYILSAARDTPQVVE